MTPRAHRLLPLLLVALLAAPGCVGGPSYAGGPTSDQPCGVLTPGEDVTIWKVDGQVTETHAFDVYVPPGERSVEVRLEYPIESDSAKPFEMRTLALRVEDGVRYLFQRKPGRYPPYEVEVTARRFRAPAAPLHVEQGPDSR